MCCLMIFQNISITLEFLDCSTECIRERIRTDLTIRDQTYQCNYLSDIQQGDQNCWVLFCLRGFEFWEKPVECRVVEVQWIMRAKQDWILCNQTNSTTNGQPFGIRVGSWSSSSWSLWSSSSSSLFQSYLSTSPSLSRSWTWLVLWFPSFKGQHRVLKLW